MAKGVAYLSYYTPRKLCMSKKLAGEAGDIFVFRFVAALVCREQILFLNSSRIQEQPRPGTAGGSSGEQTSILAALCVEQDLQGCVGGHRRCRVLGAKQKSFARPEHYRF